MDHHGEEYHQQAKAARSAAELAPSVMRNVRIGEQGSSDIEVLVGVHDALKSRVGRKKKPAPVQPTLF